MKNHNYTIGKIEVTPEVLQLQEIPEHQYIAVSEGDNVAFYVGKGTEAEVVQKFGIRQENIVGAGNVHIDTNGRLCISGASLRHDAVPTEVAGTLAQLVKGELNARGINLKGAYAMATDSTQVHPHWTETQQPAEEMALARIETLFDAQKIADAGTTVQAMVQLIGTTGLPATRETVEDLEFFMTEKHEGIKPREIQNLSIVGYKTTAAMGAVLELEEDLCTYGGEDHAIMVNPMLERKAINEAREENDEDTFKTLEQERDFRRESIKDFADYFQIDLEELEADDMYELSKKLPGSTSLEFKLAKMVAVARDNDVQTLDMAIPAYNAWYTSSQEGLKDSRAKIEQLTERDIDVERMIEQRGSEASDIHIDADRIKIVPESEESLPEEESGDDD